MAHNTVIAQVRARLKTGFDGCPVYEEGQYDVPTSLTPFVVLQFPYSTAEQITLGSPDSNIWREEGAIRIVINVRRKGGVPQGREWAEQIAKLFRGKSFGGVRTWAPTSPVSDNENDSSSYFSLAFVIPYHFDIVG